MAHAKSIFDWQRTTDEGSISYARERFAGSRNSSSQETSMFDTSFWPPASHGLEGFRKNTKLITIYLIKMLISDEKGEKVLNDTMGG
jgi:hypothetical protein